MIERRRFPRVSWHKSRVRIVAFATLIAAVILAIVFRLAQVQLAQGNTYQTAARENQIRTAGDSAPVLHRRARAYEMLMEGAAISVFALALVLVIRRFEHR